MRGKENDALESDGHGKIWGHADDYSETLSGFEDVLAELIVSDSANISQTWESLRFLAIIVHYNLMVEHKVLSLLASSES